jgi:NADPH:quinone reductase-like Zn-dependent oxidoreductase
MLRTRSIVIGVTLKKFASNLKQITLMVCFKFEAIDGGVLMKAVRYHSYGDSDVLVYEETERPVAGPGQVVVKVAGAAFNPLDVAIRAGFVRQEFPIVFPHTPGYDLAGVITEAGPEVGGWSIGDPVIAVLAPAAPGAAAEYAVAPADGLAAAPRDLDLADAAALPSVGLTAWQALFEHANLEPGQRVLINGAGGAVGGYAVQLAKQAGPAGPGGAIVTATASPGSLSRVRGYGADQVIDHTAAPVTQALAGQQFDVVLNLVRTDPEQTRRLAGLVTDGGVFAGTTTFDFDYAERGVRTVPVFMHSDAAQLAELVTRVDAGDLKVDVAARRPLTDLATVHDEAVAGQLPGKTVLLP